MNLRAARRACVRRLLEEGGGRVRFDRWMQGALFDVRAGYYCAGIGEIGRDFTTWPEMEKSLAIAIANWWKSIRGKSGGALVEVGAGNGRLAMEVMRRLSWWRRSSLRILEISPRLIAKQKALLGGRARWVSSFAEALEDGCGAVYANELVDAFPCRVFRHMAKGRWNELWLEPGADGWREVWLDIEQLPHSSAFDPEMPVGLRFEVHESFRNWLLDNVQSVRCARLLLIDYGGLWPDYALRWPGGTLRAYHFHQRLIPPEIYAAFGCRDITADVNFTDLAEWAREAGWEIIRCSALRDFLVEFGRFKRFHPQLMVEGGAADAFYVLECSRGGQF